MKSYTAHILSRAKREYAAALAWWRINRPAAPHMLRDEMRAARKLLSKFPDAGALDETLGGEVRRFVLRRSSYLLFYWVDHETRCVEILSLRHAQRLPPAL